MRIPAIFSIFLITAAIYMGCESVIIPDINQKGFQTAIGSGFNDNVSSVKQAADQGYVLAGKSNSDGSIVKITKEKVLQWSATYGGGANDEFRSIDKTLDGGYIAGGITESFGSGGQDAYVIRTNSDGSIKWAFAYGGSETENLFSIRQCADGGYIAAGFTTTAGAGASDMFIIKLNPLGNVEWSKAYGGSNNDRANDIIQTSDGYVIAGQTQSFGSANTDCYLVKINPTGDIMWSKIYGGGGNDIITKIASTTNGGYIAEGTTGSFGAGNTDILVIKLNPSGNVEWSKSYGGPGNESAASIFTSSDGGYVCGASTNSFGAGNNDGFIFKIGSTGSIQWSKTFGAAGSDIVNDIALTNDGGILAGGNTLSSGAGGEDILLIKLKSDGTTCGTPSNAGTITSSAILTETSVSSTTNNMLTLASGTSTVQNITSQVENLICSE